MFIVMKYLNKIAIVAFLSIALLQVSCSEDELDNMNVSGENTGAGDSAGSNEILGTYWFNGEFYNILTAGFTETYKGSDSEGYYTFLFSPLSSDKKISTYMLISIRKYWGDGGTYEVGGLDLDHNDDYIIIYEDPVHYYSQYRKPQSGVFRITVPEDRSGDFVIYADVSLADGTPLKIDYTGKLMPLAEE